ncbi:tail fiber assembly protein [Citrobacter portucalensis]|uniref:tail fiber assembly protein n=1 Tax=Citrobacter portucalensis TaxID=1639133 RepID=UPI0015810BC0|nr:tail fiber assembly protein [Citrobacter portucalensis]NUH52169.1 tail fiber assembly protein [Citrobacter portucalensis]NUH54012.1 tail fiber assembly protein [Citrobacter portucalensis]
MKFKMKEEAQTIKIYNLSADTSEFIGAGDAYIPPHTGLPANCTVIAPPETEAGFVAIFDNEKQKWDVKEDHRNEVVYDTATRQLAYITEPGALPAGVTTVAPKSDFDVWDGQQWVKDEAAEHKAAIEAATIKKESLINDAMASISVIQLKLSAGRNLTPEETERLNAVLDYIDNVSATDISSAPDVTFPEKPTF